MKLEETLPVYPISIVAKLTDTPIRMLREYEKKGLIKSRKINGRRLFSNCEVGFIRDLRFYLKERNMTILGLKEFYLRAGCWEIKRCGMEKCPSYGNIDKPCWTVVKSYKNCNPSICPFCPISIVKNTQTKKKHDDAISPVVIKKNGGLN